MCNLFSGDSQLLTILSFLQSLQVNAFILPHSKGSPFLIFSHQSSCSCFVLAHFQDSMQFTVLKNLK